MASIGDGKVAGGSSSSIPQPQFLVRDKNSIQIYEGPAATSPAGSGGEIVYSLAAQPFPVPAAGLRLPPIYNSDGSVYCLLHENKPLSLHDASTGSLLVELDISDAAKADFSPQGRFLVTYSLPTKVNDHPTSNLRVWSTATGALLAGFVAKTYKADAIQFTDDDRFALRLGSNEILVYLTESGFNGEEAVKLSHRGASQFRVAPTSCAAGLYIAVFTPEAGGKPGTTSVYSFQPADKTISGPVASRTIFGASEASLMWNRQGTSLLIHSQSDVDSSNASYYGATALYIIHPQHNISAKVEQSKDGPVQDAKWSPNGDRFVAIAGNMPAASSMYSEKGEPVYHFGAAHRNTIVWAPHGRFLCLAGFGNLAGEMDFYDTIRLKKLGSNTSHCATAFAWAPDSRSFLTASLAPRMNVDNNVKLFRYNGTGPVVKVDFERAYAAYWRPVPAGLYSDRPPSPRRQQGEEAAATPPPAPAAAAPKPAPYRPPRSTGSLSSFMAREKEQTAAVPVGKVKAPASAPPAKFVPAVKQRVIPGMPPPTENKKKVPGAPPAPAPAAKAAAKPPAPPAASAPAASPPAASAPETAVDKEKRAKAIAKKLKGIDEIKTKIAAGQTIDAEQRKKLDGEAALRAELASLSL